MVQQIKVHNETTQNYFLHSKSIFKGSKASLVIYFCGFTQLIQVGARALSHYPSRIEVCLWDSWTKTSMNITFSRNSLTKYADVLSLVITLEPTNHLPNLNSSLSFCRIWESQCKVQLFLLPKWTSYWKIYSQKIDSKLFEATSQRSDEWNFILFSIP